MRDGNNVEGEYYTNANHRIAQLVDANDCCNRDDTK
jgi:hypothetical protein